MKNDDPRSLNLFSRLSNYVPSEGVKRGREPLEDFCTEALAFCLIKSTVFKSKFATQFLNLSLSENYHLLVDTQRTININPDKKGRADLVLEIVSDTQHLKICVEVKMGAAISDIQKHYADYILAPQAYFSRSPNEWLQDGRKITWERVQGLLISSLSDEKMADDQVLCFVMEQFAEFLAQKGLKRIIMKTDAYALHGITSSASLLNEWTELLNSFRNTLGLRARGNPPPKWDIPSGPGKDSYYGIYGNKWRYAGFMITATGKISCYYEEPFFGEMPARNDDFEISAGEPGTVFITAKAEYPRGSDDKSIEIQKIFSAMQRDLRDFASCNHLAPIDPLDSGSDEE